MRSLVVSTFLTLDGVMQAPGGPDEDPSGGFTHGGWSVNYWDEAMGAAMTASLSTPFDLLLDIMVHGSSGLIQTLLEQDLVDEFRIWTFPLVVGPGKRLFGRGTVPAGLELVEPTTSSTGVVMATYKRAGDIDHGSFAFENPTDEELERRKRLAGEDRSSQ